MRRFSILIFSGIFVVSFLVSELFAIGGSVSGKVSLELPKGKKPGRKKLRVSADPICASKHPGGTVLSEALVVNNDGMLRNVFVYVKKGLKEDLKFDVPDTAVVLDQNGCIYKPHVLGVRAGQPIQILNNDGTLHNIHPKPKVNAEFNQAMPKFMKKKTKIFDKAEVMIPIRCDVHPWMKAYIGVMDHPFFAVTGNSGEFELKGLPTGTYEIEAWHEHKLLGSQIQEVTVTEGETTSVQFLFKIKSGKKKD